MIDKQMLIGHCGVDSGQIFLVDPCYITPDFDYNEACCAHDVGCDHSKDEPWALDEGIVYHHGIGGVTQGGVIVGNFGGDGLYPVYANLRGGQVTSVTIDFDQSYLER